MGYLAASTAVRSIRRSLVSSPQLPAFIKKDKHAGLPERGEQSQNIKWKRHKFASRAELGAFNKRKDDARIEHFKTGYKNLIVILSKNIKKNVILYLT